MPTLASNIKANINKRRSLPGGFQTACSYEYCVLQYSLRTLAGSTSQSWKINSHSLWQAVEDGTRLSFQPGYKWFADLVLQHVCAKMNEDDLKQIIPSAKAARTGSSPGNSGAHSP